jgi:hypothetical protein
MTIGIGVTPGSGQNLATDNAISVYGTAVDVPLCRIGFGGEGTYNDVTPTSPLPVSGGAAALPSTAMQSAATATGAGTVMSVAGYATALLNVTGTMGGGTTTVFEVSADNANWESAAGLSAGAGSTATSSTTAPGTFQINVAGYSYLRARVSVYGTGNVTVVGFAIAGAPAGVTLIGSLPGGSATIGSVDVAGSLPAGTNTIGSVNVATAATGGWPSKSHTVSAATTNATSVKTAAGTLGIIKAYNNGSSPAYLKLYDLATTPTVGTSTVADSHMMPAGGGLCLNLGPAGDAYSTGIAFAITANAVDTDATAVAANQVIVNLSYA